MLGSRILGLPDEVRGSEGHLVGICTIKPPPLGIMLVVIIVIVSSAET